MRRILLCVFCAVLPGMALSDPMTKAAIALAERPDLDLAGFAAHVAQTFGATAIIHKSFGPDDLPMGQSDRAYWSVGFTAEVGGARVLGLCNRIGPDGDALVRSKQQAFFTMSSSFTDGLDPTKTLQGVWPTPLPAFAPDAAARLDCQLTGLDDMPVEPDPQVIRAALAAVFSDVQDLAERAALFGGALDVQAHNGNSTSVRRLDSASVRMTQAGVISVDISSWLLDALG